MQVVFYRFSKKLNSTAQPSGGASYSCNIKDGSGVLSPTISLLWTGSGNPTTYNYAHIADFGRYYYVKEWRYEDRQWTASLTVDELASWKSYIGASNKYVLRAASEYNRRAVDTLYPALTDVESGSIAGSSMGWANYGSGGVYVVTVIGTGNASGGNSAVAQYQLSGPSVQNMITNAINAARGAADNAVAEDIKEAILQILALPFRFTTDLTQYIRNIMWFPVSFPAGGGGTIHLGIYPVLQGAPGVASPVIITSGEISLASFPASGADDWEYLAPFASYTFEMQPFGLIPIDSVDIVNSSVLRYSVSIDSMSGLGLLELRTADNRVIASRSAQIGVAVPYGGSAPNYAGAITGAVSVAAAAAAYANGNASGGQLAASIGSAVSAASPTGYSSGTAGGGAAVRGVALLHYRRMQHAALDVSECGRPLCAFRTLSTLSGYIQTRDGDVSAPATSQELAAISNYLQGGFFYE